MSEVLRLREEGLEWRALEGEIVALDSSGEKYLAVNRTGAVLWRALERGATRKDLLALLLEAFEIDEQTAGRDLDAFLAELESQNLLVRSS